MNCNFSDNPISISVMILITSWNIALSVHIAIGNFPIGGINVGTAALYFLAAVQAVFVLTAYAFMKRTQNLHKV